MVYAFILVYNLEMQSYDKVVPLVPQGFLSPCAPGTHNHTRKGDEGGTGVCGEKRGSPIVQVEVLVLME